LGWFAVWPRIYRPYLEIPVLNNAYHFIPGAQVRRVLWFRLYYTDADGKEQGEWFKVPSST